MEDNFNKHLGNKLKLRRLALGLTQTKVAKAINVTFQQIQKYENGINRLPFHSILIFVEKIKCDLSEFTNYFDGIVLSMNKNAIQNATEENANVEQRA